MNTKNRLIAITALLFFMILLPHHASASDGPLQRLLNRRVAPPLPACVGPEQRFEPGPISPLRIGGKQPVPVLMIGHRGAPAFAPENTIESFLLAVKLGCHMIELDVHLSSDGEMIVVHDDELLRTTNVKKKHPNNKTFFVSDFTAAQIQALDAGSWYLDELKKPAEKRQRFLQTLTDEEAKKFISPQDRAHFGSGKVRIPKLRDVLELAKSKNVFVNIEPKTIPRQYPGLTEKIVKLVQELKLEQKVIITSFDHEALVEVRRLSNTIATGALLSDRIYQPGTYVRGLGADAYNPGNYSDYDVFFGSVTGKFTPGSMHNALNAKLGVNVWTVNDRKEMRLLIGAGATGLITDYPNRVHEVLVELGKTKW